jgi:hypothetical protein
VRGLPAAGLGILLNARTLPAASGNAQPEARLNLPVGSNLRPRWAVPRLPRPARRASYRRLRAQGRQPARACQSGAALSERAGLDASWPNDPAVARASSRILLRVRATMCSADRAPAGRGNTEEESVARSNPHTACRYE